MLHLGLRSVGHVSQLVKQQGGGEGSMHGAGMAQLICTEQKHNITASAASKWLGLLASAANHFTAC